MSEVHFQILERVRAEKPIVHNITNYVVMNWTANCLLAAGASPVMAHAPEEVIEMVDIANALVINIGTLSSPWIQSMHLAMHAAREKGIPTVLDPVGAGATKFRTKTARVLIEEFKPTCIRSNASELLALASKPMKSRGVDSTEASKDVIEVAQEFSLSTGSIICVSGETDYIVSGERVSAVNNGDRVMTRVTGMGCAASALIGACLAIGGDKVHAITSAMIWTGIAGELAAGTSNGPGSFQAQYLDALSSLSQTEIAERLKIQ